MTPIEAVGEAVTAKQAGEMYGLKFDRRGLKAVCPWHTDHKPSLSFKGNRCKCFACNNGGDAVDLTAQIFGISLKEAAIKLQRDFGINCAVDRLDIARLRAQQRAKEMAKEAENRRYDKLCRWERNNREALMAFDKYTALDNPKFVQLLRVFAKAQDELNAWT